MRSASQGVCFSLALLFVALVFSGCGGPPQIAGDRACMDAADALWSAVCMRDAGQLDLAANQIKELHAEGRMPDQAFTTLSGMIAKARDGQWADARKALKTFIRGQRPVPQHTA